jgi:LmbE family N-acetylglucosaminyl deacetylase
MEFIDFASLRRGPLIDLIFPGWAQGENVAFYSPHDDDAALGAGYLIQAVVENGGHPVLLIFCRGDAGYSTPEAKRTIVATRKKEAARAYGELGVEKAGLLFFDVPDFALMACVDRTGRGEAHLFDRLVALLRKREISRIVFSSGHFEHWDHTATYDLGIYTSPQAGDPILADLGRPFPIKSYLAYSVWADFEPLPGRNKGIRAEKGILADERHETAVRKALEAFVSQGEIMAKTVAVHRRKRRAAGGYLEIYKDIKLRAAVDYEPYAARLKKCRKA